MASHNTARAICDEVVRILSEERKKRPMSKYELSARSGVSQQMIAYVERGQRSASLETIVRLAIGLDVDLSQVFGSAERRVRKKK